jgi:hypothetical protein
MVVETRHLTEKGNEEEEEDYRYKYFFPQAPIALPQKKKSAL